MATKLIFNPLSGNFDAVTVVTAAAVGSTPNANAVSIGSDGATIQLQPADATHPGVVTALAQTFGGNKTFTGAIAVSSIDTASSSGTLAIGTLNATTINIGNAGSTVNIQGTVITETSTTLNVTNPVFTVNFGGGAGSASNSGMQINENGVITGYVETSADRNSFILKAPNTAGVATITPGSGGILLNQSSHDPVTLGTSNGLSLSGQVLSLALASGSTTGALSASDWTTFNNKQNTLTFGNLTDTGTDGIIVTNGTGAVIGTGTSIAQTKSDTTHNGYLASADFVTFNSKAPPGNYITALTGDGSANGPGSAIFTLAVVNTTAGSYGTSSAVSQFTINSRGLVTFGGQTSIQIVESQVTGLTADLASKANRTAGDIDTTSFTAANNVATPANVTGLNFTNAVTRAFSAQVSVTVLASSNVYEYVELRGIQKGSSWEVTATSVGDSSGVLFSVTAAGQVQYTSTNQSGFTSSIMKFRATTVPV